MQQPVQIDDSQALARFLWARGLRVWARRNPDWRVLQPEFHPRALTLRVARGEQEVRLRVEPRGPSHQPVRSAGPRLQVVALGGARDPAADQLAALIAAVDRRNPALALDGWRSQGPDRDGDLDASGNARRVELFVTDGCNISCWFCCESKRNRSPRFMDWDEIDEKLGQAAADGVRVIQFMGGEATLNPLFPRALRRARELGLRTYVITNLLAWEDRAFAEDVAGALDSVMISMHAHGHAVGAAVTGRPRWWERFQIALQNFRETYRGDVKTSTVLTRHNVDQLETIAEVLLSLNPRAWVMGNPVPVLTTRLNALEHGLSLTELKQMRPRFVALRDRFRDAGSKIYFFSFPHCALGPDLWDETHDTFLDNNDISDTAAPAIEDVQFWSQADYLAAPDVVTLGRSRPEVCAGCDRREGCGGFFTAYFQRNGFGELEPVEPAGAK